MSVSEFWESTPRELYNFIRGRIEAESRRLEHDLSNVRLLAWSNLTPWTKKKNFSPTDLFLLPSEVEKSKKNRISKKQLEAIIEKWDNEPFG